MEDKLAERIYVDEEVEKLILINFKQYKLIAVLWGTASFLSTGISLAEIIKYSNAHFQTFEEDFNFKIIPYLILLIVISNLLTLFYYYNAIRLQKTAIKESDQALFKKSFLFYKRGNYASISSVLINLIILSSLFYLVFNKI